MDLRSLIEQHADCFSSHPPSLSFGSSSTSSGQSVRTDTSLNPSPTYAMSLSSSEPNTPNHFSLPGAYISSTAPPKFAPGSQSGFAERQGGYIVPPNFGLVAEDVYRSSFPRAEHFAYLRTLGLRTVLTLVMEEYPEENRRFLEREGIELIQLGMPNNKDPNAQIPGDTIRKALAVVLDRRRHPLLIHCNRGKHRTGCLVGCLRKMQKWETCDSLEEYARYAHPKERLSDQTFISSFLTGEVHMCWTSLDKQWLPTWIEYEEVENATLSTGPDGQIGSLNVERGVHLVDGG